ncbi:Hypothetical predicted protein [Mytilus galloprovincialis]|uniref:Uncharacterized protein n=1 Tax=Mytilus galloprovincialis TaxID=29158 RepID=A0A8B6E2U0_MYTGA|nr:Hypothetical predicted protein [Mytilus galloprovincialis]
MQEVQQMSLKRPGKEMRNPKSWMPPECALTKMAKLVECQPQYLAIVWKHDANLPNFLEKVCLVKDSDGNVGYNFGENIKVEEAYTACGKTLQEKLALIKTFLKAVSVIHPDVLAVAVPPVTPEVQSSPQEKEERVTPPVDEKRVTPPVEELVATTISESLNVAEEANTIETVKAKNWYEDGSSHPNFAMFYLQRGEIVTEERKRGSKEKFELKASGTPQQMEKGRRDRDKLTNASVAERRPIIRLCDAPGNGEDHFS